jgi:hypothetical protein
MTYAKTIVCFANSRKPGGRCVAGREVDGGQLGSWIRPVSVRTGQEISWDERHYNDGRDPALLDIIEIPLISAQPQHHQIENHLIDPQYYWQKRGTVSWQRIQSAVETVGGPLWRNGFSSSNGENDRVPEAQAHTLGRSLYLVRPEQLVLHVATEGGVFGPPRRRVRAAFQLEGNGYRIVVTDPIVEAECLREPDGQYEVEDALACASLSEGFNGYAYKLAAAIFTKGRVGGT